MTPEQKAGLLRLMLRRPDRSDEFMRAVESSMVDLFESYELASIAFLYWSTRNAPTAVPIAEDYRQILIDLEHEAVSNLAEPAAKRSCQGSAPPPLGLV